MGKLVDAETLLLAAFGASLALLILTSDSTRSNSYAKILLLLVAGISIGVFALIYALAAPLEDEEIRWRASSMAWPISTVSLVLGSALTWIYAFPGSLALAWALVGVFVFAYAAYALPPAVRVLKSRRISPEELQRRVDRCVLVLIPGILSHLMLAMADLAVGIMR